MKEGKEVYRCIKLTDNIKPSSLGVMDQIRLMFSKISNDDVAELDTQEKLSVSRLKKLAALSRFIDTATKRLNDLHESCVTVQLASEFLPFIDEVIDPVRGKGRFYDFEVIKPDIPIEVKHQFIVRIRKKKD